VIWGGQDQFIPSSHLTRVARVVPGAYCRVLPRVGHSPNWEAPGAVLDAFSRLQSLPVT
jgi:pimeloyl-ACP methyl ester carboxylesterase